MNDWPVKFSLYSLKYKKYISLPGRWNIIMVMCSYKYNKLFPITEIITVEYLRSSYNKYLTFEKLEIPCSINKSVEKTITCLKFFNPGKDNIAHREYYRILYSGIDTYGQPIIKRGHQEEERTWQEASDLCSKTFGGHLPWFESKDNLYELLALFKIFEDLGYEGDGSLPTKIYIGLRFNSSKVSFWFCQFVLFVYLFKSWALNATPLLNHVVAYRLQITIGHLGHFILDFFAHIWTQWTLRHILGPILVFDICNLLKVKYHIFDTFMKS